MSGLGGLGHLAIQFARKLGFYVVAISGSKDKEELAKKLGAHVYFSAKDDVSSARRCSLCPLPLTLASDS